MSKRPKVAELPAQILAACKTARALGQYVDIDFGLPSVLYHRDDGTVFRFAEESAERLFELYRPTAEQTGLILRDVLLWAAQGWRLDGSTLVIGNS